MNPLEGLLERAGGSDALVELRARRGRVLLVAAYECHGERRDCHGDGHGLLHAPPVLP